MKKIPLKNVTDYSSILATIIDAAATEEDGTMQKTPAIASGALRGGGLGAQLGSIVPGVGTFIGGGAGAVIGGITSAINNRKMKEELATNRSRAGVQMSRNATILKDQLTDNFDTGSENYTYYKYGGKISTRKIGKNVIKIKGKKHEEGGVKLSPSVEVEDGELIKDGNKVFSNRIGIGNKSYAQIAERISRTPDYKTLNRKREKLEDIVEDLKQNEYTVGTALRRLNSLTDPLDRLFEIQENSKDYMTKRKFGLGGTIYDKPINRLLKSSANYINQEYNKYNSPEMSKKLIKGFMNPLFTTEEVPTDINNKAIGGLNGALIGKKKGILKSPPYINGKEVLGDVAPFIDNTVNAILTKKTPAIPAPILNNAAQLKTSFNIDPQLQNQRVLTANRNKLLAENTADPQVLRNSLVSANLEDLRQRSNLYAQKENIETELKNKQSFLNTETTNNNNRVLNDYNLRKLGRASDIQSRISENAANLTEDLQQRNIDNQLKEQDQQNLALILSKYQKSGVLDRAKVGKIMELIRKGYSAEEAMSKIFASK